MRVNREDIESKRTAAGGWTREQLAEWGIGWPPPKGWKEMLIGGERMRLRLDRETIKKLRIKKRAERAFRKLSERHGELSVEQRKSLKCVVARGLKEFPTNAEIKLKPHLLRMGFDHCKVILGYIPDFSHDRARVIVEVDGGVHERPEVRERDRQKDAALRTAGWTVIRVTNGQVESDLTAVLRTITRVICHEAPSGG